MSRIDDALTRVTGKPADPRRVSFFRFLSEATTGRRRSVQADERRYPSVSTAARQAIDARVAPSSRPTAKAVESDAQRSANALAVRQSLHYVGFACRAVWRHKFLVVFSFVLTFSMIVAATILAPRTYEIEVKLLTQRSPVMTSLSNPGRVVPYDADAPTRAAAETVLRRDNVISLIRQLDLINEWDRTRAPILRVYDRWKAKIRGHEPTLDEKLDNLVTQIERRMVVSAAPASEGTVSIYLTWPDAHSGYLLVDRAQQAFLDARQVAETQAIGEAIAVLERYGQKLNKDLFTTLGELNRTRARALSQLPPPRLPSTPSSLVAKALDTPDPQALGAGTESDLLVDPTTLADPRLRRLKSAIAGKRLELGRLEYDQRRKLDELQAQLTIARRIYTPNHPTVQSLQQSIAAFQHSSPQIMALRTEVDRLEAEADEHAAMAAEQLIRSELGRRGVSSPRPARVAPLAATTTTDATPEPEPAVPGLPRPNAVVEFATLRLRTELNQLQGILERTDAARIEFAVSQAAFKHRYTVITPAEEPGDQSFPDTRRVIIAGFFASVLFAIIAAIAKDVLSNRILEPWQVQRQLGLPVLGMVKIS